MGQNISFQQPRANSSPDQNRDKMNMPRKTVDISNDTWLEALKFLTCTQWSQKRYVCGQMNGIIERNISFLPKMVFACADMYYYPKDQAQEFEKRQLNKNTVIAFDTAMQGKQLTQWFEKRGFTPSAPVDIPADDLFIATRWTTPLKSNLNLCIHGSAQETIPYCNRFRSFRKPVLFFAQFNTVSNRDSWNYLAQFHQFIYHPMTYIKEVKMFAVNQTFIDSIKCNIGSIDNEPRYIRCESFSLERFKVTYDGTTIKLKVLQKCGWVKFVSDLITKFRASPRIEGAVPTIEFLWRSSDDEWEDLGPNLIDQEVDSQGALYMISSGQNRMQISLCESTDCKSTDCKIRIYSV